MSMQFAILGIALLLGLAVGVYADVFSLGPGLTNLETVRVGDPGNTADTRYYAAGYGSVGYTYDIGKYEVTAAQYCDFLNKVAKTDTYGLYDNYMWSHPSGCKIQRAGTSGSYSYSVASDYANRPVNIVSFWDACRFVNWLNNGQPEGSQDASTTEQGAYTLDGYRGELSRVIARNAGWKWALASEDEWVKAAYYRGGGPNAGYWDYPTQRDLSSPPGNDVTTPDSGNSANYRRSTTDYSIGEPYYRTNAGEFENSASAYGTFDQGGNVAEFTESLISTYAWDWINSRYTWFFYRATRGGSYTDSIQPLQASYRAQVSGEAPAYGFRVVAAVPEAQSLITILCGLAGTAGMLLWRKARR